MAVKSIVKPGVLLWLMLVLGFLVACESNELKKVSLEGELFAKNLLSVQDNLPDHAEEIEYCWYISPTPHACWEKLQGIWTGKIILLTSYKGNYLTCEISYGIPGKKERNTLSVISNGPIEYKGNPNTDWFRDAGYGIMVHYLKPLIVPEGGAQEWNAIRNTRMDMSLKHNISTHTLAAEAGNKQSLVSYNYGFGEKQVNTPYCDYSSGEKRTIDEFPEGRWVEDGVPWFLFTYLGEKWGGKGQQFKTEELVSKTEKIVISESYEKDKKEAICRTGFNYIPCGAICSNTQTNKGTGPMGRL